jgi:D-serine deaminase-like pyridoxal phosphate-dependent protein
LLDVDYSLNTPAADWPVLRHALFGYCTVISLCETHAVLDGGLKAFAVDSGLPRLLYPGWRVKGLSDEHTVIVPEAGAAALAVGDKVKLVPGHCDPTINLHDWLIAFRGNAVEEVWPVAARGALF